MVQFVSVAHWPDDQVVPHIYDEYDKLAAFSGLPLSDILEAARSANADALSGDGRFNAVYVLPELTPFHLGEIMTVNGREARILIGDKIPVLVEHIKNGETTTTTEYTDAGIKLAYTPRIHPDGTLTAAVQAEVSTPVLVPEMKAYRIVTRQAETQVRMGDIGIFETTHDFCDCIGFTDMAEEFIAQAFAAGCTGYEAGDVDKTHNCWNCPFRFVHAADA